MCFELDPSQLLNATELALQTTLKKAEVKLDPLTDIDKVSLEYLVLFMQKLIANTLIIMIKTDSHHILSTCELLL